MSISVSHVYQVDPFQTLDFTTDTDAFGLALNASVLNFGTVNVTYNQSAPQVIGAASSGGQVSLLHNESGGVFRVSATDPQTEARGVTGDTYLTNEGLFEVMATGRAVGVETFDGDPYTVINGGALNVTGDSAWGLRFMNGGILENTGSIAVNGQSRAVGVLYYNADDKSSFDNRGTILVSDTTQAKDSVAVYYTDYGRTKPSLNNSGLVQADYTFFDGTSGGGAPASIINSGTLIGLIQTGEGADQIHNTGSIVGDIQLGNGNDVYDGASGHLTGVVNSGDGQDVIIAGSDNDTIDGGAGSDTLTGGSGDDTFVFELNCASDIVTDFTAGGVIDRLDLQAFRSLDSVNAVLGRAIQAGPDTFIDLGGGDAITLSNVTKDALTAADFVLLPSASADLGSGADFNGDGKADVLWRDSSGYVALWQTGASPSAPTYVGVDQVASTWHIQGAADFNGDGKADVLWRNNSGFTALWTSSPSGQFSYTGVGQVGLNWHVQALADFNGDGKADVLWRDDNGLTAMWTSNSSNSALTYVGIAQVGPNWRVQGTGDFNGDGLADVLWRDDSGLVALWEAVPGSSQVSYVALSSAGLDWSIVGTGDFNGDGKADILWRQDTGRVGLWQSGPSSLAVNYADLGVVGLDWRVQATGDFNGDGKADVLWRDDAGRVAHWDSGPGGLAYQDLGIVGAGWFIS